MGVITKIGRGIQNIVLTLGLLNCGPKLPAECRTHNDTTTILNSTTDGRVADFVQLQQTPEDGDIITPALADLVNEVHYLSGHSLPQDLPVTLVSRDCDNGRWYSYRGTEEHLGEKQERGVYINEQLNLVNINTLFHEIGHFQADDVDEITAELNRMEQGVVGYPLMLGSLGQMAGWSWVAQNSLLGGHLLSVPAGTSYNEYALADIFLFQQLQRYEGDFTKVRRIIHDLKESDNLEDTVQEAVQDFEGIYGETPERGILKRQAQMLLDASRNTYLELQRRFGEESAAAYLTASSYFNGSDIILSEIFPESLPPPMSWVMSFGLEGYTCKTYVNRFDPQEPCEAGRRQCDEFSAGSLMYYQKQLCCDSVDEQGSFHRWFIEADGHLYKGRGAQPLQISSLGLSWPYGVEVMKILEQRELREGENCMDL